MYHYGAWIRGDPATREMIWQEALNLCCRSLLLCAKVGCGCTGLPGAQVCSEVYHGEQLRVAASEGPNWRVITYLLRDTVHVDVFVDELPQYEEVMDLKRQLEAFGGRLYWEGSTKAYTDLMLEAIR